MSVKIIFFESLKKLKKLAGTKWGASSKIPKQVYVGNVRPVLEFASTAWAPAAKTNTKKLEKVKNAGMRFITGNLSTTPLKALTSATKLPSLVKVDGMKNFYSITRSYKDFMDTQPITRYSRLVTQGSKGAASTAWQN